MCSGIEVVRLKGLTKENDFHINTIKGFKVKKSDIEFNRIGKYSIG